MSVEDEMPLGDFEFHARRPARALSTLTVTWWLVAACLAAIGTCMDAAAAAQQKFENSEYRFKVLIPRNLPTCTADSETHIHGVGTVLVGKDCRNGGNQPALNIWADYNSSFQPDAVDALSSYPGCSGKVVWADGEWARAIGGLKTAMCRVVHVDGKIHIVLEAQAGTWPAGFQQDEPYINYTVGLNTTRERFDSDLRVFKRFVSSIEIK